MTDSERAQILKMIDDGKITAEQGLQLMQALDVSPEEEADALALEDVTGGAQAGYHSEPGNHPEFAAKINRYKKLWIIPLSIGLLVSFFSSLWMYNLVQSGGGLNGWLLLAFPSFLLGVGLIALGAGSRNSRWIYLNVQERAKNGKHKKRIVLAFPIPIGLVRWGISNFGHHIPDRERKITDDVLKSVFESSVLDEPLLVEVDEEDGDHVQVYIG